MEKIIVSDKIVMKKISEVKPYIRNPRKNDKTVKLLTEIIPKVGFNVPILIDKKGVIVKGHARYAAAVQLGMKEIPCVVTDADEESIRLDRIADNKISEFSQWNVEELMHEIDAINLDEFEGLDLREFGLPIDALDTALEELENTFDDKDEGEMSEEERRARYEKYLSEREASVHPMNDVTPKDIIKAEIKQAETAEKPKKYFKIVCPDCGKIMFIAENEAVFEVR